MASAARLTISLASAFLSVSLSGCATILSDRSYEVTIDNAAGPTCFSVVDRDDRVIQQGITPQQVTLRSSAGPFRPAKYRVVYAGQSGIQEQPLDPDINWWTAGNVIIGGLPGIAIDAASGALWRLDDRVVGRVPADQLVSNAQQGNAMLANATRHEPAGPSREERPQQIRSASYESASDPTPDADSSEY